ncbi:ATPase [Actinoplanes capillaceus]|uniref:histidine kinase n=1 Tax=Actinoplanes campanulatus TaxID=113559 RepID=A0ABQ3WK25_9ACTN|nr:histidine kinase [Actinoplanes capillaceus]GID46599.1 ATPase [Actinoplanes capillaceus]
MLRKWARVPVAVAAGAVTGVAELLFLLLAGMVAAFPPVRGRVAGAARWIAGREQRRLAWAAGEPAPPPLPPAGPRVFGYLAARALPALLGGLVTALLVTGVALAGIVVRSVLAGTMTVPQLLGQVLLGAALLTLNLQGFVTVAGIDARLARTFLESSTREELERRIGELAASRAEVVAAVDVERQRIERDLHDGLQQRLVALGMLLGRARRSPDPERTRALLDQAHADAQRAVEEMREVAWRVYPSALAHSSLDEVLAMVAQRSAVPVRIDFAPHPRPGRPVETALYFVACEAVTNTAKHAAATVITIAVGPNATGVEMVITDDGVGGADPDGSGLHGLARRVAALDGRFEVRSPPGEGTTIRVELPCG